MLQKDSIGDTIVSADPPVSVRYTGITVESLLTKRISRGEDGALIKQAAASPVRGVFTDIANCGSAEDILTAYADEGRWRRR